MKTTHQIIFENSNKMLDIPSKSIDLVVTSPPYPMIEMWDAVFIKNNAKIDKALKNNNGPLSFELMHKELDAVWKEVFRVLKNGGIVCINIGDATRTLDGDFALYPNHSRIISYMLKKGFTALPEILWRKQTNAPNKFMGSGMFPPGAYITLEHEFILIFKKGRKREFERTSDKENRRTSSFFWEERNTWHSDVWMDLKGASQSIFDKNVRQRSASFPFEVPYRLINMFSVKGDTVLDPFLGMGTTVFAAVTACRNSIGYELESGFQDLIFSKAENIISFSNERIRDRIKSHLSFIKERFKEKGGFIHTNNHYKFPVVSKQEKNLILNNLLSVQKKENNIIEAKYSDLPRYEDNSNWEEFLTEEKKVGKAQKKKSATTGVQLRLLE